MQFYANSQGQLLAAHSVMVARVARQLATQSYAADRGDNQALSASTIGKLAYWAGLLHDIGKLDPHFQSYIQDLVAKQDVRQSTDTNAWSVEEGVQIEMPSTATEAPKGSFGHPRHQEVSWWLFRLFCTSDGFRQAIGAQSKETSRIDYVAYAIYWHHAKPLRSADESQHWSQASSIGRALAAHGWGLEQAYAALKQLLAAMAQWEKLPALSDAPAHISGVGTPGFKPYYADAGEKAADAIQREAYQTAIRACVVSADRIVSRLSAAQLMEHLQCNTLPAWDTATESKAAAPKVYAEINAMVVRYAEQFEGSRTDAQTQAAIQLCTLAQRKGIAVLQGPAGSGKSKVFLHTLALCAQSAGAAAPRIFVLVPRTAIGEGLFEELVYEYQVRTRVELLLGHVQRWSTGDGQVIDTPEAQQGSGDLVITTIDQLCKSMLSHERLDWISELARSHVVFDEFHELFDIPGISLMFREVMHLRASSQGATLLVSATPNPYLLAQLHISAKSTVAMPALHSHPYTLTLQQWPGSVYQGAEHTQQNPWLGQTAFAEGAFVISNTATLAQACSVARHRAGSNVICFHSRYTPHDKQGLLQRVMATYGKQAPAAQRPVLISGPIVQASLNISTQELHTEATTAENFLQRVGRCNRFGEHQHAHIHYCWANSEKTGALANASQLKNLYQAQRTAAFTHYLRQQLPAQDEVTLEQLYTLYAQFHQTPEAANAYAGDQEQVLEGSRKLFEQDTFDPVRLPAALKAKSKTKKGDRLASRSLRARSYFVLPVKLQFHRDQFTAMQLLWASDWPPTQLMTDPLNFRSDEEENTYRAWTQKPLDVLDSVRLNVPAPPLKKLGTQASKHKRWEGLRYQALHRDHPVVISSTTPHEASYYYLQLDNLLIGLVQAKHLRSATGWDFLQLFKTTSV